MKKLAAILLALFFCVLAAHADGPPAGFYNPSMGGAPSNSNYLLYLDDPLLDHSRVLYNSSPITLTDSGTAHGHFTIGLGIVPASLGGSGRATLGASFDAFANASAGAAIAAGDILYYDGTNWHRLPISTDGKYLRLASGLPSWSTAPTGAPADAQYILGTSNAGLTNGMVLTAGTGIGVTNVPGTSSTIAIDSTVATLTGAQILTNKTLTSPTLGTSLILAGSSHNGTITWPDWVAARAISIPDPGASAAFVLTQGAQTIVGSTTFTVAPVLTSGTLSVGGFTVTVPGATDTLANLAGVQVLSNKELSSPSFTSGGTIVLKQTSGNYTLSWANPAAARAYAITDVGTSADFAMKTGAYTAGGVAYGDGNKLVVSGASGSADIPLCSGTSGTGAPTFEVLKIVGGGTNNGSLDVTAGTLYYGDGTKIIGLAPTTNNGYILAYNTTSHAPNWVSVGGTGTVTSVAMTGDGVIFNSTVSGSPITASGTLTPALLAQTAHYALMGPTSAGPTAPTFRAIDASDLPITVNSGTSGHLAYYSASSATVSSAADAAISAGQLTLGLVTGPVAGSVVLYGATSGTGTISVPAAAGTGTVFKLPGTNGTTGYALTNTDGAGTTGWNILGPAGGGTGLSTLTAHYTLVGEGTSNVALIAPSATAGVPYISGGSSADPSFGTVVVAGGGTGQTALTQYGVLIGEGTSNVAVTAAGTAGYPLVANTSANPTFQRLSLTTGVTDTLPVANGGIGATTATANTIFSGPTSGSAAAPTFRAQVLADLPTTLTHPMQERLYLISGNPVSDGTNVTGNFFVGPYLGNCVSLPDATGNVFTTLSFSEISTAIPTAVFRLYDAFIYNSSGSVAVATTAWDSGGQVTATITGVTAANPCVVTVSGDHHIDIPAGALIGIAGIVGNLGTTAANGLNGKVFKVVSSVYTSSTAITLEAGIDTTSLTYTSGGTCYVVPTARTTGLTFQNGMYLQTGSLGRVYIGTFMSGAEGVSAQCEDNTSSRLVWNYWNQIAKTLSWSDSTPSWTYSSATARPRNGNTAVGTGRAETLGGMNPSALTVTNQQVAANAVAGVGSYYYSGVRQNSVLSGASALIAGCIAFTAVASIFSSANSLQPVTPSIGYAFNQAIEGSVTTGVTSIYGSPSIGAVNYVSGGF